VFTEETTEWLQVFTDHAAAAIKNAQLYNAELKQRELAEALTQAAASVSSSLELAEVLDQILVQVMRVVPCQAANIMLIDGNKIKLARHRGYGEFVADASILDAMEFPMSWPGLQEMYTNGKPVVMRDTHADERWQSLEDDEWIRSFIGIPLIVDQVVVGFLNIDSDKPNFLSDEYLPRLQTFADYASTAIKNARSYQNSRQRAEEMAALVAVASAVSKSLDYMQVIQIAAEQMTNVLQVMACAISDYNPHRNQVSLLLEYSPDNWHVPESWYQPYDLEQYPQTRQVLETGEPLHLRLDDPHLDSSERSFMLEAEIESLIMLPLISQDRTIGLIELLDTKKDRTFSIREIALGLSIASHAAAAIENASLYRQLQDHVTGLEMRVQKRTQELQEASEYIEGILASVPDAVFVLDQENRLARVNQAGEHLLAQTQSTGLNLFNPQLLQILKDGIEPDMQSIIEVGERAYQGLSSQLLSDDGQSGGQIIVFRDVTQFRELDQMKTKFVSDVSHELRTPLTNLTLYLSLLATVRDHNKQNNYIQTLQRETERLTHLIEDLLTISRLEAKRIQFFIQPTNLNHLTENLVRDRIIFAAQKEIKLEFTAARTISLASADENMLTQAISNLLTNAINYTQPGGSIQAYTAQPEPGWVTIHIADTGVGIPPEELEHIFDRFYRGRASQQTGAEGTGLGLAISEEIIHRMGGKITLESLPGEGSIFTIWLRAASDNQ
jgi:signal transduction histidine kinase